MIYDFDGQIHYRTSMQTLMFKASITLENTFAPGTMNINNLRVQMNVHIKYPTNLKVGSPFSIGTHLPETAADDWLESGCRVSFLQLRLVHFSHLPLSSVQGLSQFHCDVVSTSFHYKGKYTDYVRRNWNCINDSKEIALEIILIYIKSVFLATPMQWCTYCWHNNSSHS